MNVTLEPVTDAVGRMFEIMKCKECPYFKLVMKPIKHVDFGLARCLKLDLVVDLVSMRQINRLKCVEEEQEKEQ